MSDLSDNEYFPPDEEESYDAEADIKDTYVLTLTAFTTGHYFKLDVIFLFLMFGKSTNPLSKI